MKFHFKLGLNCKDSCQAINALNFAKAPSTKVIIAHTIQINYRKDLA